MRTRRIQFNDVTSLFLVTIHYLCYQLHNIHIHTDSFIVSNFSINIHPVVDTKVLPQEPKQRCMVSCTTLWIWLLEWKGIWKETVVPYSSKERSASDMSISTYHPNFSFMAAGTSTEIRTRQLLNTLTVLPLHCLAPPQRFEFIRPVLICVTVTKNAPCV